MAAGAIILSNKFLSFFTLYISETAESALFASAEDGFLSFLTSVMTNWILQKYDLDLFLTIRNFCFCE